MKTTSDKETTKSAVEAEPPPPRAFQSLPVEDFSILVGREIEQQSLSVNLTDPSNPLSSDEALAVSVVDASLVARITSTFSDKLLSSHVLPVKGFVSSTTMSAVVDETFLDEETSIGLRLQDALFTNCSGTASENIFQSCSFVPPQTQPSTTAPAINTAAATLSEGRKWVWLLHAIDGGMVSLQRFVRLHRRSMDSPLRGMFSRRVLESVIEAVAALHQLGVTGLNLHPSRIFIDVATGAARLTSSSGMKLQEDQEDERRARSKASTSRNGRKGDLAELLKLALWLLDDRLYEPRSLQWLHRLFVSCDDPTVPFHLSVQLESVCASLDSPANDTYHPSHAAFVKKLLRSRNDSSSSSDDAVVDESEAALLQDDEFFHVDLRLYYSQRTSVIADLPPGPEAVLLRIVSKSKLFGETPARQLAQVLKPSAGGRAAGGSRKKASVVFAEGLSRAASRADFDAVTELYSHFIIAIEVLRWLREAAGAFSLIDNASWSDKPTLSELRDGLILARLSCPHTDIPATPADRIAAFNAYCQSSLFMSHGEVFTFEELSGAQHDPFVLYVLCRVAAAMYAQAQQQQQHSGKLDARVPQPSRAMYCFGECEGWNVQSNRTVVISPVAGESNDHEVAGKEITLDKADVKQLECCKQGFVALPRSMMLSPTTTSSPTGSSQQQNFDGGGGGELIRQMKACVVPIEVHSSPSQYSSAASSSSSSVLEMCVFAFEPMRNAWLPVWILHRLATLAPAVVKEAPSRVSKTLIPSKNVATVAEVPREDPVVMGDQLPDVRTKPHVVKVAAPATGSGVQNGGKAAQSAPASVIPPARRVDLETTATPPAPPEVVDDGSSSSSSIFVQPPEAIQASADDLAMLICEGFVDSKDPGLTTMCSEDDLVRRFLPLLGTRRLTDVLEKNEATPDDAHDELFGLVLHIFTEAQDFYRQHVSKDCSGPSAQAWAIFDIATFVIESNEPVDSIKQFASSKPNFSRPQMFSTPKFLDVRSNRAQLMDWLERISKTRDVAGAIRSAPPFVKKTSTTVGE